MIPVSNVTYWFGVVEDIQDSEMLDRVRVRVYGAHSANRSISDIDGTPTEHLMWMNTIMPVTSAGVANIGQRHGLLPGSTVFGMYIDPEMQQGVVLGSMATKSVWKDPNKGFSDPTGEFYNNPGESVSSLPFSGQGQATDYHIAQGDAGSTIYQPDLDNPGEEYQQSLSLRDILAVEEGCKLKPYVDAHGYSVGYGHFIVGSHNLQQVYQQLSKQLGRTLSIGGRITQEEANNFFIEDIKKHEQLIKQNSRLQLIYNKVNEARKFMLVCWVYQMGLGGVLKFTNTLAAIQAEDWKSAYQGIIQSAWAKQTPLRAKRVASCIYNGNLEAYEVWLGIKKAQPKPKKTSSSDSIAAGVPGKTGGYVNKAQEMAKQKFPVKVSDITEVASPNNYTIPAGRGISRIIIHCTASQNGREMQISSMDADHLKRGWRRKEPWASRFNPQVKALGYQFVIGLNGTVYPGRAVGERGCHTGSTGKLACNTGQIGIQLQGGSDKFPNAQYNGGRFTTAQWKALDKLVRDILKVYPNCSVKGHRDWIREAHELKTGSPTAKACPAFDVQTWWRNGGGVNQKHLLGK